MKIISTTHHHFILIREEALPITYNQIVTKMLFRAYSTSTSRVVPHHSTILAVYSLTSRFGWDVVHSISYGRRHDMGFTHAFQPTVCFGLFPWT